MKKCKITNALKFRGFMECWHTQNIINNEICKDIERYNFLVDETD